MTGGFRLLTGKAAMLPRWAFGYIQSQERYESAVELVETAKRFRQEEIPLDALVLDWMSWKGNLWGQKTFDGERFPDPADMIQKLHEQKAVSYTHLFLLAGNRSPGTACRSVVCTISVRGMVCRGALECEQYYLVRVIKSIKNKYKERQKNGQYKMFQD